MQTPRHGFGKIFVLSAPSGSGKTTLVNELKKHFPQLLESISYTTRLMRDGEQNDIDYHFVSHEKFKELQEQKAFVEWAEVHKNLYGTPASFIDNVIKENKFAICDIDFQGALNLKEQYGDSAVLIFILPPSMKELEQRLRGRKTDDDEVIQRRLDNARREVRYFQHYRYIVVNDQVSLALNRLDTIFESEMSSSISNNLQTIQLFLDE
ncbi:guanylate kinase [bacterium]|nr:guanylate kinase [bacterium]